MGSELRGVANALRGLVDSDLVHDVERGADSLDRLRRERDEAREERDRLGHLLAEADLCTDCGECPECPECGDSANSWTAEWDCAACNPTFVCPNPNCKETQEEEDSVDD